MGLYPALAALEMLLYPKSALTVANEVLARLGIIEVIPPEAPLTLLIWGLKRVLPVRLTQLTITEEAFDPTLNPIRAKVSLDLRVLTYQDLGLLSVGGALFMAHQVAKEAMATLSSWGISVTSRVHRDSRQCQKRPARDDWSLKPCSIQPVAITTCRRPP